MLSQHELQALRQIKSGEPLVDQTHRDALHKRGLIEDRDGQFAVTQQGDEHLGILHGIGEAIADIIVPGAGSNEALKRAAPVSANPDKKI